MTISRVCFRCDLIKLFDRNYDQITQIAQVNMYIWKIQMDPIRKVHRIKRLDKMAVERGMGAR